MLLPDCASQLSPEFVRLAQNIRAVGDFAYFIVINAAELEAAFVGNFDPLEEPRDTPASPLEPGALSTHQNHRARALSLHETYEMTVLRQTGEVRRSQTVAAIDKQFRLGRDRIKVDGSAKKQNVAIDQSIVQR
jgi:hypothetical protein